AAVGGNAVLLLNVPADRRGLVAAPDAAVLADLGTYLRATFAADLAAGGTTKTYAKAGEVYFDAPTTVDLFDLAEDVVAAGQRVERFRIEVLQNGGWRECARGTTIGYRRLLRTAPITGDGFRYWIEQSRGKPAVARFALFQRPELATPPRIARDTTGQVTITTDGGELRYTTDGSPVTGDSPRYAGPFAFGDGGTVRARTFAAPGTAAPAFRTIGETAATFGIAPTGWRVVESSSEQGGAEAASKAIDGDPRTHWHTRYSPDTPRPPHHLVIDLGKARDLAGFVYQPRAEGDNGTVADYAFSVSADGTAWREVARGTFANIAANPVPQVVRFAAPATGVRFVKFVAVAEVRGRPWASCAELSVLLR
ncbi:MAG: discoidin domain-containing protein, partial [Planctomycetes bacterium]|nr:discoidin domain-containing protein [Planctomycetota bacterium]